MLTRITDLSQLIGIRSLAAFLQPKLSKVSVVKAGLAGLALTRTASSAALNKSGIDLRQRLKAGSGEVISLSEINPDPFKKMIFLF